MWMCSSCLPPFKDVSETEAESDEHVSPIDDLARELATIHQICASHLEELRKLSESKVDRPSCIVISPSLVKQEGTIGLHVCLSVLSH